MRAFLAIELPHQVQAAVRGLQQELARETSDVKWVEQAHLHVTMRFLGDITDEQQRGIEQGLARIAAHTPAITARLSHPGTFPATSALRVIWVGIDQGAEELSRVAEALEDEVTRLGLPAAEKPFVAHVTLGRVRFPKPRPQLFEHIQACAWMPPPAFSLTHVTLFQSVLSSAGPTYTALARAPFLEP